MTAPFDPETHLSTLSRRQRAADGSWQTVQLPYLETRWRLVWLRRDQPDARITTRLEQHEGDLAVFSATVTLTNGAAASGWGSETADDWKDYIEKAETKALGRALAALGFGTQFCEDFTVTDPLDRPPTKPSPAAPTTARGVAIGKQAAPPTPTPPGTPDRPATAAQLKAIRELGVKVYQADATALAEIIRGWYDCAPEALTARQATEAYEQIKAHQARITPQ